MGLGATIVNYAVDPRNADELHERVRRYLIPAARTTRGYKGYLLLDQGEGKRCAILLFDSLEEAEAAQGIIGPVAAEHVYSLMASPSAGALGSEHGVAVLSDGLFA